MRDLWALERDFPFCSVGRALLIADLWPKRRKMEIEVRRKKRKIRFQGLVMLKIDFEFNV